MTAHIPMSKNEYVQIDDEQAIFDAMNKISAIGKEATESNAQFNSLLGKKQELYNLAKVLAKDLIHDLHDLGTFVKPSDAPKLKSPVKRRAPRKKPVKRATPKRLLRNLLPQCES